MRQQDLANLEAGVTPRVSDQMAFGQRRRPSVNPRPSRWSSGCPGQDLAGPDGRSAVAQPIAPLQATLRLLGSHALLAATQGPGPLGAHSMDPYGAAALLGAPSKPVMQTGLRRVP